MKLAPLGLLGFVLVLFFDTFVDSKALLGFVLPIFEGGEAPHRNGSREIPTELAYNVASMEAP